ncbi:MAG: hypothetical protein IH591_13725 [Bacteroidales bacterium]|nr:hypothetical protein [Bacteroidales bacterium]
MFRNFKRYALLIAVMILIVVAGCASSKKNNWIKERKRSGYVNTSQLGKNRYYFSSSYQKKLGKSMKRKK